MNLYRYILAVCILITVNGSAQKSDHPSWSLQSNIYEVNLRQYSKSGTFKEFAKHLPRLRKMGVEILWFMPITPIGIVERKMTASDLGSYYAVRDYKGINPEFGTMKEWKALVKQCHALGFKVITDWVPNHSSPDNPWITNHPDFYTRDSLGNMVSPFDWTDVKKLNYNNRELRDSMIAIMKFWLTETGIDGFRCDVAEAVPEDFWQECIAELKKVKNVFMLAEGEKSGLHIAGFDETYTWSIMGRMTNVYAGKLTVLKFDSALNKNIRDFPVDALRMYFTTNHDENSWNGTEFEKYGSAYKTFAVFTHTFFQSVPLIYSGQEVPNNRRLKFFVKDPIVWNKYDMAPFYSTLLHLRRKNPALAADAAYKKVVTANDHAIFAYTREKAGHKIAVILNLSRQPQSFTIKDPKVFGQPMNVFMKVREKVSSTHVFSIEPWGYIVYEYK